MEVNCMCISVKWVAELGKEPFFDISIDYYQVMSLESYKYHCDTHIFSIKDNLEGMTFYC